MRRPSALVPSALLTTAFLVAGCAATEPFPPAPTEVLLVVNGTARTLSVIPTGSPGTAVVVPLVGVADVPAGIAAREGIAVVPMGEGDSVVVVDLAAGVVLDRYALPTGSGATGAAIIDDSIAYVANPWLNSVTRVNYLTGDTASVAVGVHPQALVFTRGRLFVVNGNVDGSGDPLGPSWITVIDPVTNEKASGIDSIPLPGPGNARAASVGADGLLYLMNAGDSGTGEGRLSIVNPVAREEVGNFGGFGNAPGAVTTFEEMVFVSSRSEGVMEFDSRLREIERGAGEGVAVPTNSSIAASPSGKLYAVSAGPCSGGTGGVAHIIRAHDLVETGTIPLGECATGALITTIPAAP